jgi:RES domain-containing protein
VAIKDIFLPHPEWSAFTDYLRKKNRYRLNKKWEAFIQKLLDTAKNHEILIKKHRVFWRARIGEHWLTRPTWPDRWSSLYAHPLPCSKMGAPPTNILKEGRLNPKGISCLYLSSDYKTAIAEVRPRVNTPVSAGKFKIIRNQTVLDTTSSVSEESDIEHIWKSINDSFSDPMAYYEDNLQYVPTQYLAELFKGAGFDGIKYISSVKKGGYNLLLFNKKMATCIQCRLYYVEEVIYKTRGLGRVESRQEMDSRIYL